MTSVWHRTALRIAQGLEPSASSAPKRVKILWVVTLPPSRHLVLIQSRYKYPALMNVLGAGEGERIISPMFGTSSKVVIVIEGPVIKMVNARHIFDTEWIIFSRLQGK